MPNTSNNTHKTSASALRQLQEIDKSTVWHPYASIGQVDSPENYIVESADGAYLQLAQHGPVIDGMSSWWCAMHGYNHPQLNQAVVQQLSKMSHVMFGGLSHEPGIRLAQRLQEITPEGLNKVFFSDSGSVAVEVAIKMALQYWHSQGQSQKHKMLSLMNGYHGDTFGAMSVCDPINGMHHIFANSMPKHIFADAPPQGLTAELDPQYIAALRQTFEQHHQDLAALILEPVVQGAGGMRFYAPAYLKVLKQLCEEFDVLFIADEIATGFGRTGKLFACEHADISPDIMCLGKALTGGYMTLAATLCNDRVADGICSGEAGVFMHGPTFMGNPLACATALASIELLLTNDQASSNKKTPAEKDLPWKDNITAIEAQLTQGLAPLNHSDNVAEVRIMGAIAVVEMKEAPDKEILQAKLIEHGVWLRPFGKLVYAMPPFICSPGEIATLCNAMVIALKDSRL